MPLFWSRAYSFFNSRGMPGGAFNIAAILNLTAHLLVHYCPKSALCEYTTCTIAEHRPNIYFVSASLLTRKLCYWTQTLFRDCHILPVFCNPIVY